MHDQQEVPVRRNTETKVRMHLSIKGYTPNDKGGRKEWDLNIGGELKAEHFIKVAGAAIAEGVEQLMKKFSSRSCEVERDVEICKSELYRLDDLLQQHLDKK